MLTADPYPAHWARVESLCYLDRLELGRAPEALRFRDRESCYFTLSPYRVDVAVDGAVHRITVPAGFLTDLASVPAFARMLVGRVGPHLEAAIVHDWLYVAWQLIEGRAPHHRDWAFANQVMYAGLRAARVAWPQRLAIRAALEAPMFSWRVFCARDDGPGQTGILLDLEAAPDA